MKALDLNAKVHLDTSDIDAAIEKVNRLLSLLQEAKKSAGSGEEEGGDGMDYISERVTNISELEGLIRSAYCEMASLRSELEKENPSMCKIDELSKQIHLSLLKAKDFEFCVERRRTTCLDD